MERERIKIDILPNQFLKSNGKFDIDSALKLAGKIAGICYDNDGFNHLETEAENKTMRRVKMTLENGHHSVYDHISISFNLQNLPKMLAMILNNEHQYTTSEKSARYTSVVRSKNSVISEDEEILYNEWLKIFELKIKDAYGDVYNDLKIRKLAQENARYLVTVFMPTQMVYTTSLRQINYIASWMQEYINDANINNEFERQLAVSMNEFLDELYHSNVLVSDLMKNDKHRKFSIWGSNIDDKKDYFDDVYLTTYKGSFAQFAQAQRHRTLDYKMELLENKEYYIPPIIKDDDVLVSKWLNDMDRLKLVNPQGELVKISEVGKYEDFILKCKERLCTAAQLEIMQQTRDTLLKYKKYLEDNNSVLANDIEKYSHGARCTFPDFNCTSDCKFKEGKTLTRKI